MTEPTAPLLRVLSGNPSDDELAALTVVLTALSTRRPRRRPTPVGAWGAPAALHRRPLQPGPGGWLSAGRSA
ncbi:acyl-CoA carboxylase subunit epsilon [Modestobacter sp. SYSU DS0875]